MALIHEFEKSGNWLFKRRGWLPVLFVIPAVCFLVFNVSEKHQYNFYTEIIFLVAGLLGLLIRALIVGRTPKGTSGRNIKKQVAEELNTTGIYSILRHPLYLGNFFMWLGPVLLLKSVWFIIVFSLAYWIYYERIMFAEEQFLRRKFKDSYDAWSMNVRAFVPSFRNFRKSNLPFSIRNVLKREYHGFASMFIIFAVIDLARNYFLTRTIYLNPLWKWSLLISLAIWTVLRITVKMTGLLNVKGR